MIDDGVEFDVVTTPDSEERECLWPRVAPAAAHRAHHENWGDVYEPSSRCFRAHPERCIWNSAEWFCTLCNRTVPNVQGRTHVNVWYSLAELKVDEFYN